MEIVSRAKWASCCHGSVMIYTGAVSTGTPVERKPTPVALERTSVRGSRNERGKSASS